MDLVNQIVEERRKIEQEDEERRQAAEAARRERQQQQQQDQQKGCRTVSSTSRRTTSNSTVAAGGAKMPPRRPQKPKDPRSSSVRGGGGADSKNSATQKNSLRQSRREARKEEDAAAVAAASSALLDSIVPPQLVESASDFVLSVAPRIFSFHTRHITSFRHPFFTMLCYEEPEGGAVDPEFGASVPEQQQQQEHHPHHGNARGSRDHRGGRSGTGTGGGKTSMHRGGTAMVTTAHVSAVENALKARRRQWQTIGEYLVDRFSDISSAYPIEIERWAQASYMLDAVLLQEDLSRRRRDILEAQHVVRALEACWTSWGGTTSTGIDFDTYRAHHIRLYRTLLGVEALDPVLAVQVDQCIERDWLVDREVVGPRSPSPSRLSGAQQQLSRRSPSIANNNENDSNNGGALPRQGSTRSLSAPRRDGSEEEANNSEEQQQQRQQQDAISSASQIQYEVPFRRFSVAMLELADNWTRARVGDVFSQVFAKFLMKVVWSEPSREKTPLAGAGAAVPASFAHNQLLERQRAERQKQFEEQVQQREQHLENEIAPRDPEGINNDTTRPNTASTAPDAQSRQQRPGSGSSADLVAAAEGGAAEDEWSKICEGLRRRAFLHRGGPIVRMVPPECPGVPPSYVALAGTRTLSVRDH